jgi:hypothetical protein
MSVHHESLQFKIFADETADGIADFCNDYGMPANGLERVATSLRDGLHSQGQSISGQLPLFVTGSIESTKGVTKARHIQNWILWSCYVRQNIFKIPRPWIWLLFDFDNRFRVSQSKHRIHKVFKLSDAART